MDTFKLVVSKMAQKIAVDSLSPDLRRDMQNHILLNNTTHTLYKIPIGIEYTFKKISHRKSKKHCIEKTDRIVVEITVPDDKIQIIGIHPRTMSKSKEVPVTLKGGLAFPIKILKLDFGATIQKTLIRNEFEILTTSVPPKFQWIYTKLYLNHQHDFDSYLIISVTDNAAINNYVSCKAFATKKNMTICKTTRKKIRLN